MVRMSWFVRCPTKRYTLKSIKYIMPKLNSSWLTINVPLFTSMAALKAELHRVPCLQRMAILRTCAVNQYHDGVIAYGCWVLSVAVALGWTVSQVEASESMSDREISAEWRIFTLWCMRTNFMRKLYDKKRDIQPIWPVAIMMLLSVEAGWWLEVHPTIRNMLNTRPRPAPTGYWDPSIKPKAMVGIRRKQKPVSADTSTLSSWIKGMDMCYIPVILINPVERLRYRDRALACCMWMEQVGVRTEPDLFNEIEVPFNATLQILVVTGRINCGSEIVHTKQY